MKKIRVVLFVISSIFLFCGTSYATNLTYPIYVNDKKIVMDVDPQMTRGASYVPISFIAKELGADVKWENPKVTITKGNLIVTCTVESSFYTRGDQQFSRKETPYLSNDRVYVPLRLVSELLNCKVNFEVEALDLTGRDYTKTIHIKSINNGEEIKIEEYDDKNFIPSNDNRWGVTEDRYPGERDGTWVGLNGLYVRNNEKGEIRLIHETVTAPLCRWTKDNNLLFYDIEDRKNPSRLNIVYQYNPENQTLAKIAEVHGFSYIEETNSIAYFKYLPGNGPREERTAYSLLNLDTGTTKSISKNEYYDVIKYWE